MEDFNEAIRRAILESPGAWMESHGKIRVKSGDLVTPKLNELQRELSDVIVWCKENDRPVRVIILKPRQKGCSTVSVGALYHMSIGRSTNSAIIGGAFDQSANLFKILKTYSDNDTFNPKGFCKVGNSKPLIAKWQNGSECTSMSANNKEAGRSGTYQALILTEFARWAAEGVANAKEVAAGLLKCVGFEPNTMIIMESTAAGCAGDYYNRWQTAITFDEAKEGKAGYIKLFFPWFAFKDSKLLGDEMHAEGIFSEDDYTDEERSHAEEYGLTKEQVAWWRMALREECDGDQDVFNNDYPFNERDAFMKSGRTRFSQEGLSYQRQLLRLQMPINGVFSETRFGDVSFQPTSEAEAMWEIYEKPKNGLRYLIGVDNATGASQTSGGDPDSHGIVLLRAGYMKDGQWHEPAVAAHIKGHRDRKNFGVWFDTDILAEEVFKASKYYGDCLIVPEVNMDRGMIELLKARGANIYMRKMFNRREGVRTKAYGFQTNVQTKNAVIEALASAIREAGRDETMGGIQLRSEWIVRECENFIVKDNGKAEAGIGAHDDQVMATAIGLFCIEEATPYYQREIHRSIPRDLIEDFGDSGGIKSQLA